MQNLSWSFSYTFISGLLKSSKFIVLRLLVNNFMSQKIESVHFYYTPKQNSPPGFYYYLPGRRKLHIPPEQRFLKIYFLRRKRVVGRTMELKKLSKFNLRGYWSQVFIDSTIFAIFTFLACGFLCHNLASSKLKCEGSLTN